MKKIIVASALAALLFVALQYENTGAITVAEEKGPGPAIIAYF